MITKRTSLAFTMAAAGMLVAAAPAQAGTDGVTAATSAAEGAIDIVQIDSCRMGGLNEVLAVLLVAAKYDLPVWPHAGGVGLCEYVQHLSMIDYVAVSGTREDRRIEFVDHLQSCPFHWRLRLSLAFWWDYCMGLEEGPLLFWGWNG